MVCRTYVLCLLKSWNQRVSCEDINNVTYDSEYIIVKNDNFFLECIEAVKYTINFPEIYSLSELKLIRGDYIL